MVRKIALASMALVLAVGVYYFTTRGDQNATPRETPPDAPRATHLAAAPASTQPRQVIRGADFRPGPGQQPKFNVIDRDTGRVKYEFSAREWKWATDTTLVMDQPDIRIHLPQGEITYINAHDAEFEVSNTGRKDIDPRRGRLWGGVKIILDRTTRAWRDDEANRARLERDAHPEFLVHIDMQEARFDMETSRLTADGPITVHSEEADITANKGDEALVITWNQVDNRIDFLTFKYGGRMELRRDAGLVDMGMPGTERDDHEAEGATAIFDPRIAEKIEPTPATRPTGPALTSAQVMAELEKQMASPPRPPKPEARKTSQEEHAAAAPGQLDAHKLHKHTRSPVVTYAAHFKDNVEVHQQQAGDAANRQNAAAGRNGELTCDDLKLIFDIGRPAREKPEGESASQPAAKKQKPSATQPATSAGSRIVLTWNGPLELRPIEGAETQTGRRFDAIATGRQVNISDTQGHAVCTRMIYRNETKSVWLTSDKGAPAELVGTNGRKMVAPEIALERAAGRAMLRGPGYLTDPRTGEKATLLGAANTDAGGGALDLGRSTDPVDIHWKTGVEIALGQMKKPAAPPQNRAGERASGNQSGDRARAVSAGDKPKTVDYLQHATFRGSVEMTQGKRHMAGDEIELAFAPPRRAGAMADNITTLDGRRDVVLRDADQIMSAADLHVDLGTTPDGRNIPKRAEGRGEVRVEQGQRRFQADHMVVEFAEASASRGRDASGARVVASHVIADGKVGANDPVRQVELNAEHLDVSLDDRGELRRALAIGPGTDGWAYTKQGDYEINGHRVQIDLPGQQVDVPGRGHAVFVTRRDFDGRALADAVRVNVTFDDGMSLDGRKNLGIFNGHVHTSTDTHDLKCDRSLTIRFADLPADSAAARPASSAPAAVLVDWLHAARGDTPRQLQSADPAARLRKRPTFVLAEGNAIALTTDSDPQGKLLTRLRISGPTLEADLREGRLDVPGRGTLLIEDYRPPRPHVTADRTRGRSDLPLGSGANDGPSQTVFSWANAMSFNVNEDLVTFDRNVQMIHWSGRQMLLNGRVPEAIAADVNKLRAVSGRDTRLNCENLVAQFVSQKRAGRDSRSATGLQARWTDLRRMDARGHVDLKDGTRSLFGDTLVFRGETNTVILKGQRGADAMMYDEDETSQHVHTWRGPIITWNRATGAVDAPDAQITSR